MRTTAAHSGEPPSQQRPTEAKWLLPLSLQARLSILVALIVGTVVTALTYLQVEAFARAAERDLLNTVVMTGRAVADDLASHPAATPDEMCF